MRILQIIYESPDSPFGFGGAGVRAHEIYSRLKQSNEIEMLCMKYPGAREGDIGGLRHIFVGTESGSLTKSVIAFTSGAASFVRKHGKGFDVIVENFLPSTPFFTKYFTSTPVILQIQGIMGRHSFRKYNFAYSAPMCLVEGIYPGLYDRFVFVSDVTKRKVLSRIRRSIEFCPVIPNGIDEKLLNAQPEDGDYILFFSRIDIYTKGLDLLIRAFERIACEYPRLRLVLAGYEFDGVGDLTSGLSASLKERIQYAGFVSGAEKARLLANAKMFVLPSRHESFPVSILEAAACGKAVIVSDIPELRYVEENGFGISFPSGVAEGLGSSISRLLNDVPLRLRLGRNGRTYAERFPWDTIALEFEKTLLDAVSDG